jgi:ABC-2 type transport system ATP-binding protein
MQHPEMSQGNAPVVAVNGLVHRYGKKVALDGVTLEVPRGRVFGLVGENGAGKTTLIRHLLGLLRPDAGTVSVFGTDPVADPVGVLSRIGCLSEDRDLPDWMRVDELIRYTQAFYPDWDENYAEELRELFMLDWRTKVRSLSRGERAKAALLCALAFRPELLVLDEPSSGLDPAVRQDILEAILRDVVAEGRTVLFSSHLLDEVERVSDIVAMIHHGKVVLCGPLDDIKAAHRRVVLHFEEAPARRPEGHGIISAKGSGREWTLLCDGANGAAQAAAAGLGGRIIEECVPSLEEIFLARVLRDRPVAAENGGNGK